jgi:hypothetical protein
MPLVRDGRDSWVVVVYVQCFSLGLPYDFDLISAPDKISRGNFVLTRDGRAEGCSRSGEIGPTLPYIAS